MAAKDAMRAGIDSVLDDIDVPAAGASPARTASLPHIAAAVAARSSGTLTGSQRAARLAVTPGSGVSENTLNRNFQALRTPS